MSTTLAALVVAAVVLLVGVCLLQRRRNVRREERRVEALRAVAKRLDTTIATLEPPDFERRPAQPVLRSHAPVIAEGVPGRAALLDALRESVERARTDGSRLTAAVVQLEGDVAPAVCADIGALAGVPVYAVGPRSLALVLPGFGRAGALGVLARIQAERGPRGRAVELGAGEGATELAVRLLAADAGD